MKKDKWKNMPRQKLHKKKAKRNFEQRLSKNMPRQKLHKKKAKRNFEQRLSKNMNFNVFLGGKN